MKYSQKTNQLKIALKIKKIKINFKVKNKTLFTKIF